MFLFNLAISYRETGDLEAAIRTGTQGLALLRSAGASFESAQIENDLAMAYLASGNSSARAELAAEARREFEEVGRRPLPVGGAGHRGAGRAGRRAASTMRPAIARRAVDMARATGNRGVELTAMLTEARALRASDDRQRPKPVRGGRGPGARRARPRSDLARSCASGPSLRQRRHRAVRLTAGRTS